MPQPIMMEDELQCPVCLQLFEDPVILSCSHNVCFKCAEILISKNSNSLNEVAPSYTLNSLKNGVRKSLDSDKVSLQSDAVLSDSDSGYFGSAGTGNATGSDGNSSPTNASSISGVLTTFQPFSNGSNTPPNGAPIKGVNMPMLPDSVKCLTCPVCHRTIFLDERGAAGLTRHTLMKSIVGKYASTCNNKPSESQPQKSKLDNGCAKTPNPSIVAAPSASNFNRALPVLNHAKPLGVELCHLCDKVPAEEAVVKCLQCVVNYCCSCLEKCHPARGPLAKHSIVSLKRPMDSDRPNVYRPNKFAPLPNKPTKSTLKLAACSQHSTEKTSLYCESCRTSICVQCHEEGKHKSHITKPIGALYKQQKSDLSGKMSSLSNKARQAKDLVVHLKEVQGQIEKCSLDLEEKTISQCNHLIEEVERKRDELIQKITREKETKSKIAREQLQQCTMRLKQTTGLLEYCIEVVKDNDVSAFLQISQSLMERVSIMETQWSERSFHPRVTCEFDLDFNSEPLALSIGQVDFVHTKVPDKPTIKVESNATNNSNIVTLIWLLPPASHPVDGFKLEMDNGNNGPFKEVYCGSETVCTVDGLLTNSLYRARVRAFNRAGLGPFSDLLHLQTSEVANFEMDSQNAHPDIVAMKNTISSKSADHKIVLGNIGFSRGIHYWEFVIGRLDQRPSPAFGVALPDVDKSQMLGKDGNGWSLYGPDEKTSWFFHDDYHLNRCDVTLTTGLRVGMLLDLNKKCISYFIEGKLLSETLSLQTKGCQSQGQTYFPAVSLNKHSQVILHTGLRAPLCFQPAQHHRSRNGSISNGEIWSRKSSFSNGDLSRTSPIPRLKSFSSLSEGRSPRNPPPPPPIRRSSSGTITVRSDDDAASATGSDPLPLRSSTPGSNSAPSFRNFASFIQRKV